MLPFPFLERFEKIIPKETLGLALDNFSKPGPLSLRVNTLKIAPQDAFRKLKEEGVKFGSISWSPEAVLLPDIGKIEGPLANWTESGYFYRQSLSSLLPAVILEPRPGENILDMCAAPGGKTTQIAALMQNQGNILAIEAVRPRFYKLKSVVEQMGANIVSYQVMDGRRYRHRGPLFDRVLVDAPCSSEGRFKTSNPETYAYWSLRKIKEMVQKQRGLLLNASRMLKDGGTLVYSTCTFAPEENEGVIDWFLRKAGAGWKVVPVNIEGIARYPAIQQWPASERGKFFNPQACHCLRVFPQNPLEGFFVAKLIKIF